MTHTKPRFTVLHLNEQSFREAYFTVLPMAHYRQVATVDAESVDAVYQLTNHGVPGQADNWTDNPGVTLWADKSRTRSTSVGDVIGDENGDYYRVASFGFDKLDAAWFENANSQSYPVER